MRIGRLVMVAKRAKKGFTLVELMIVVAIMGVLAAIAVPLYTGYIEDARQSEATANLQVIRTLEEQNLADAGVYVAGSYTETSTTLQTALEGFQPGPATELSYDYVVDPVTGGANPTFLAKAIKKSDTTKWFSINQANVKVDQSGNSW
jgi:prepilin-type N-terminal cleavage/methylation domain-containing protein